MRSKQRPRKSVRQRRGTTVVEFALVAPFVFLFIFGLVEVGRMVMVQQSLASAARDSCRKAALATTTKQQDVDDAVRSYLQSVVSNPSDVNTVRVGINPASLAGISSGTPISVEIQMNVADVSWLPGNFLRFVGNPVIIGKSTQTRE